MGMHFFDIYAMVGLALVCVPVAAWLGIARNHYLTLTRGAERVQVCHSLTHLLTHSCIHSLTSPLPNNQTILTHLITH